MKILNGLKSTSPRWEKCVDATNGNKHCTILTILDWQGTLVHPDMGDSYFHSAGQSKRRWLGSLAQNLSRKLFLEPKLAMARKWQKSVIFEWNFALFLSFFMDSGHIYVPSGVFWDFSSRTHIGDLVITLF